ncbi:PPE domain-containing protein [Mycobacterium sp. pUA109]|uniref:PPE family protein n=1 Tax=Mycobacterium sp. pUA109 TaxID=3238982 RepID=UPI00351B2E9D
MDFGALPPEINSARMYAGAGSGPMLAAASAWNDLAAELRSAASTYQSVITGLTSEGWLGPASTAMAAAAAPYVAWMTTTAGQAEQTAEQAQAAATAYENAFAMTVPPADIAANRSQLTALVATNFLGQNTPAIAATEAHYGEMWAQDATAMYGYAASSAAASKVPSFTSPEQTTNPGGLAAQSAAATQATGTSSSAGAQATLSQLASTVPNTLQGLASPASSASGLGGTNPFAAGSNTTTSGFAGLLNFFDGQTNSAMGTFMNSTLANGFVSGQWVNPATVSQASTNALSDIAFLSVTGPSGAGLNPNIMMSATAPASGAGTLSHLISGITPPGSTSVSGSAVSAGMGRATLAGALSVPQNWATATPVTNAAATAFPASGWTAAPEVATGEMPGMPGMPGAPMAASAGRSPGFAAPRYGFRPTVMTHPPAAG